MRRRRFLKLATGSTPFIAGCSSQTGQQTETLYSSPRRTSTATPTRSPTPPDTLTDSPTDTPTPTETPRENPDTIFVGPDGSDTNVGSRDEPLGSIQEALIRAQPGETVYALPGRYHEVVRTVRPGEPGNPITVTGPPEAVFIGGDQTPKPDPFEIMHSHFRVTGLTFDGLQNPDRPDDISSYAKANVSVDPIGRVKGEEKPPVVSDVKIKPHAVGNTRGNCVHVFFGNGVEVGEFEVIGPAGVAHFVFDEPGHDGEIVYIGTSAKGWEARWHGHIDRTKNVYVHHIDNSAGYKHAEIADAKPGTENVTVEYCTSVNNVTGQPAIHLGGKNGVARWNKIRGAERHGVTIGNWGDEYDRVPDAATENSVYGNEISGSDRKSVKLTREVDLAEQGPICGNKIEKPGDGNPTESCPSDIPSGDGVGHTGGDSPWV